MLLAPKETSDDEWEERNDDVKIAMKQIDKTKQIGT